MENDYFSVDAMIQYIYMYVHLYRPRCVWNLNYLPKKFVILKFASALVQGIDINDKLLDNWTVSIIWCTLCQFTVIYK